MQYNEEIVALFHVGFTAAYADYAWRCAHALNQQFVEDVSAEVSEETANKLAEALKTQPTLTSPKSPAIIASLLLEIVKVRPALLMLDDFCRLLFWALHDRHVASKSSNAA